MVSSHANFHHKMTHDNDYNDLMTKCANDKCAYYFYYMGRSDYCEKCR
jgi:hypothetical protein